MRISRIQALVIALGLVLIGLAVSRSGVEWHWGRAAPDTAETRTFAQGYMLRDGVPTGEPRPGAPNRSPL